MVEGGLTDSGYLINDLFIYIHIFSLPELFPVNTNRVVGFDDATKPGVPFQWRMCRFVVHHSNQGATLI